MANRELMVGSFMVGPVERFFVVRRHAESWLTEDQMRAQLVEAGLGDEEIELQFARARSMREWMSASYAERPTAIGYRNEHGQTVVRKTDEPGQRPFQRVFIVQCHHCGHEHAVEGCAIPGQRCPMCQRR